MKTYVLALLMLTGCGSAMQTRGSSGDFCYTWGDAQAMTHVTCRPTKTKCQKELDKTESREAYRTLSTCDFR